MMQCEKTLILPNVYFVGFMSNNGPGVERRFRLRRVSGLHRTTALVNGEEYGRLCLHDDASVLITIMEENGTVRQHAFLVKPNIDLKVDEVGLPSWVLLLSQQNQLEGTLVVIPVTGLEFSIRALC
jgi:hypothetical protein